MYESGAAAHVRPTTLIGIGNLSYSAAMCSRWINGVKKSCLHVSFY